LFSPNALKSDSFFSILGLAFPAISNLNENPFFVTANDAGATDANQFGFYLASTGSELYLGGTNDAKYSGDIEFNAVDSSQGFWQATGAKAKVGSTSAVTGFDTIIDSGTTLMYGPPAAVKKLFAKVSGSKVYDSTNGTYSIYLILGCVLIMVQATTPTRATRPRRSRSTGAAATGPSPRTT
jgi:cathepsin D